MSRIDFTVPGVPVGKGRARATTRGGHVRMFTPAKTVGYENQVAHYGYEAMTLGGFKPMEGPLNVDVLAVFPKPASWSKKKTAATVWHTGKPDGDNILKAVGDGLNGIVWRDDSQVACARVVKVYSEDGSTFLRVTVEDA